MLVAPTNFGVQTAAYVPTVTLLPYCDGDVSDLQGQKFTDVSRDLTADDTSLKSSVLVMGANHNFFNTEWTPGLAEAPAWDDWGGDEASDCGPKHADRLTAEEQQAVGTAYIAGAVHLFADGDQDVLPLFDGTRARVASTGDAQVLSHAIGGGRDVRAPDVGAHRSLPDGATTRFCRSAVAQERVSSCAQGISFGWTWPHWTEAYENAPDPHVLRDGVDRGRPVRWAAARRARSTSAPTGSSCARSSTRRTGRSSCRSGSPTRTATATCSTRCVLPAVSGGSDTAKYWAQALVVDPSEATGRRPDPHRAGRPGRPAPSRAGSGSRTSLPRRPSWPRSPTSGSPPSTSTT